MNPIAIEAKNLTKIFSQRKIINNLSFQIKKGECFGILGPAQSGKTTLMKLMHCSLRPTQGSLYILGNDAYSNVRKIKEEIGVLQQQNNLDFGLNVIENLILFSNYFSIPKKKALIQIEKLLRPMKLETLRFSMVPPLGFGIKRRLAFVRAQVNNPKIIFLDEPTYALDLESSSLLWNALKIKKEEGKTLILCTQSIKEIEALCDQVALLEKGRILIQGPPLELLKNEIGVEVCELDLHSSELSYYEERIKNKFTYRTCKNKIFLFLESKNERKNLKKIFPDQKLHFKNPSLEDIFIKRTGSKFKEREKED